MWGPGDWGVDELLAQYDEDRRASWPLQDAGGDVIALCDRGGSGTAARLVWQGTYDAYGRVITAQTLRAHAPLHVGHKGLFFDRLDTGVQDALGNETPRLAAASVILGYNRNRTLHTEWGRYLQKDPNATGLVVLDQFSWHGGGLSPQTQLPDIAENHADGSNIYQYVHSNPQGYEDPLGLNDGTYMHAQQYGRLVWDCWRVKWRLHGVSAGRMGGSCRGRIDRRRDRFCGRCYLQDDGSAWRIRSGNHCWNSCDIYRMGDVGCRSQSRNLHDTSGA